MDKSVKSFMLFCQTSLKSGYRQFSQKLPDRFFNDFTFYIPIKPQLLQSHQVVGQIDTFHNSLGALKCNSMIIIALICLLQFHSDFHS